jgi:hypothetical protein
MNAHPLRKDRRPHLVVVREPVSRGASEPTELRALPRVSTPRPALTMAGVTSGLQLLLAARRAARIADNTN